VAVQVTSPAGRPTGAATSPQAAWKVLEGDCIETLAGLEPATADAAITDPPYGIDFQGERWDGQAIRKTARRRGRERLSAGEAYQEFTCAWAAECLRVLRPGAHLAAFGSPRTAHRLGCGLEEAGFELRDCLLWLYGTGLPKSRRLPGGRATSLKPAWEPILLARKPPAGSIEHNLQLHGTGALNSEACRVDGRFPANVLLSHSPECDRWSCGGDCALRLVDEAAAGTRVPSTTLRRASRLFYSPKASRAERDAGCEALPPRALDLFPNAKNGRRPPPATNPHPTVKPLALMRWLVRLLAPEKGLVLDPFCGSGTTGCAAALEDRRFLGIEREPAYVEIARARIAHWGSQHAAADRPATAPEQARAGKDGGS
jgi:DNA modification methylase